MTEADWLACEDPARLLRWLTRHGRGTACVETGRCPASERKLRLVCHALLESIAANPGSYPDFPAAWLQGWINATQDTDAAGQYQVCSLLRDIFGNPFRPVSVCGAKVATLESAPDCTFCRQILDWHCGTVLRLAQTIYDERRFKDLPILADALEEAGCTEAALLEHCRGKEEVILSPFDAFGGKARRWLPRRGPHVRGCWVLDLLLGKS